MFHSQKQFAIAHSYCEKFKFLKQKIMFFFDKKLIFYKEMSIFNQFLPNSELWPAGVIHMCTPPELFDIGGSENIIWSDPSSNGLIIRPLLTLGGRKNLFFLSGVGGWNNHLHFIFWAGTFSSSVSRKFSVSFTTTFKVSGRPA